MGPALFGGVVPGGVADPSTTVVVQNVYDDVRALLQGGSSDTTWGVGNDIVQPFFARAYAAMWGIMRWAGMQQVKRDFYFLVPAYTSIVNPVTIGIPDFGSPAQVWERGNVQTWQIATTDTGSPITVTTADATGLGTNADVTVSGVTGTPAPWGRWFITVIDSTSFTLNGSVSDGVAGVGGTVAYSAERFDNFPMAETVSDTDRPLQGRLLDYQFKNGVFQFRGATQPAQIRVTYFANDAAPTNPLTPINIPASRNFLGTYTASMLARARGWYDMADKLAAQALGPSMQEDGSGGQLRLFAQEMVRNQMQTMVFVKAPYRNNNQSPGWGDFPYGFRG